MSNIPVEKVRRRLRDQPKPVIQRWMRIKALGKGRVLARALMRLWLPHTERERRKALEQTFETTKHYAIKNENGKFRGVSTLINIGLYLLIAERDFQAVKIDALTHPHEWTRKLHARTILLTLYEWNAQRIYDDALCALKTIQVSEELKNQAIASLSLLRQVQGKLKRQFGNVRNMAIGHRDPDALIQYRLIRDLREDDVMAIAIEFYAASRKFLDVLTQLLLASSTLPALLRQWSAQPEK